MSAPDEVAALLARWRAGEDVQDAIAHKLRHYAGLFRDAGGCGVCGSRMMEIRGRYPGAEQRAVCPTCLAERMDMIRELTARDYGQAYECKDTPKPVPIHKFARMHEDGSMEQILPP